MASIYTDPPLIVQPDGSYRHLNQEERAEIAIKIQIEDTEGKEDAVNLAAFLEKYPEKDGAILKLLKARGLLDA